MLKITIPAREMFDERTNEFRRTPECTISLEHSLVSISKWEAKWHKPFLSSTEKTLEEAIDYIRCMTLTQNVNPIVYYALSKENIKEVNEYIDNPMTATWFSGDANGSRGPSRETITSELIYYWMIALNIPSEYQKWHLNRLLTLIRVCNIKNSPKKKMSKAEILRRNAALNAERRARMNTKG